MITRSPDGSRKLRLACLTLAFSFAACGQGEGDYCQVDQDCRGDLRCVTVTHTCRPPGESGGTIDAEPDARTPDANTAPDAGPDAMLDAAP
jgi:hypothetical protein